MNAPLHVSGTRRLRRGFTLVELSLGLVTTALIGLSALAVGDAMIRAERTRWAARTGPADLSRLAAYLDASLRDAQDVLHAAAPTDAAPAVLIVWYGDQADYGLDGQPQVGECEFVRYDLANCRLELLRPRRPADVLTSDQHIAHQIVDAATATAAGLAEVAKVIDRQVLAQSVSGVGASLGSAGQRPVVRYAATVGSGDSARPLRGLAALQRPGLSTSTSSDTTATGEITAFVTTTTSSGDGDGDGEED